MKTNETVYVYNQNCTLAGRVVTAAVAEEIEFDLEDGKELSPDYLAFDLTLARDWADEEGFMGDCARAALEALTR